MNPLFLQLSLLLTLTKNNTLPVFLERGKTSKNYSAKTKFKK